MPKLLAAIVSSVALVLVSVAPVGTAAPSRSRHPQKVTITILAGDRVSAPNIALAPGVPVQITVTNVTREFHTFAIPALGLSELVLPARGNAARETTFTFTPQRWGAFAWYCAICPSGMHGRPHTMGGTVYLIVNPSALP